jgi:hypothetical protein
MDLTEKPIYIDVFDYFLPMYCRGNEFTQPLTSNGPCKHVHILIDLGSHSDDYEEYGLLGSNAV